MVDGNTNERTYTWTSCDKTKYYSRYQIQIIWSIRYVPIGRYYGCNIDQKARINVCNIYIHSKFISFKGGLIPNSTNSTAIKYWRHCTIAPKWWKRLHLLNVHFSFFFFFKPLLIPIPNQKVCFHFKIEIVFYEKIYAGVLNPCCTLKKANFNCVNH